MGVFFVYILKSSVCLAIFYLFYRVLLSKETFHRFNRVTLLGVLAVSSLIPLVEVTTHEMQEVSLSLDGMLQMVEMEPVGDLEGTSASFPWKELMLLAYAGGILFFLMRHLWSLGRMVRLLRTARRERLARGITLFVHDDKDVAPFSWMQSIAVSEADLEENGSVILTHERAHIHNRHSWDLVLAEVCIFLQWFNPAAWLLKQELQNIHEYEADEWVITNGIDAKTYQLLIIKKAVGARLYSIANSFNHSSLKKRITMMIKKKSNPWARMKCLMALPLAAVAMVAFARPEVSSKLDEISSVKVNDLTSIVKAEEAKNAEKSSDEEFKVYGKVLSVDGKVPVVGASVILRGTTMGALTDADGKFTLSVKKDDVILISFVGYQTQSVIIKDESPLTILMKDDVQAMEEVTVVGYASDGVGAPSGDAGKKVVAVVDIPEVKDVRQEDAVFQVVEEMPQFPGGMQEAMKFLAKNIKYPVAAQQAKIEGRVIVRFVVGKDGSVSDVEVMRSINPELDAEAVRVINMMPKWVPGKQRGKAVAVKYTMPIVFRLQTPEVKADKGSDASVIRIRDVDGKSPLVVVDGKVMEGTTLSQISQEISPEKIESISVLKGEAALAKYGDKGKDGAVIIETKKEK